MAGIKQKRLAKASLGAAIAARPREQHHNREGDGQLPSIDRRQKMSISKNQIQNQI
jgi:hypothetical protein